MQGSDLVIRAVDVGFGNVKFTKGLRADGNEVVCDMFPSLAPQPLTSAVAESSGERNTVQVNVDGRVFEVGKEVMHAMSTIDSRTMDIMFPTRPEYMALVRGAMHYMDVEQIDMLVVGLPVSSIGSLGQQLRQRMVGEHKIGKRTVKVLDCMVAPQPVGGLWDFAARSTNSQSLRESTTLIVDPGWFTLDWVVASNMKLMSARAGAANNAGMGAVIRAIGQSMATAIGARDGKAWTLSEQLIERIDRGLRTDMHVNVNQRREPLDPHLEAGYRIMRSGMQQLLASIGSKSDIDSVVIVGGPAALYKPVICEEFGVDAVRHGFDPVFANVRGFQIMGMKATRAKAAA